MNKGGPIIVNEDDPDDLDIFTEVFKDPVVGKVLIIRFGS